MTEEKFAEMIKGIHLSDKEIAILRMQFGLSYDEGLIDQHPALRKRLLMMALIKLPKPAPTNS